MHEQDTVDIDLISRFKRDDLHAFQEIYDKYWDKMYSMAYLSLGVKEEAEDIVQSVFENIWKGRHNLNILKLSTYLIVAVKNATFGYIKSQINMRKYQEYLIFQELQNSNLTEQIVNYEHLQKAINEAMTQLPEKTVEVFKLSRFSNKSVKEIANELQLSEKAVEYHITKSLKLLKNQLKDYTNLN
jgi:RNA polymerase sigma-70 factor (ECF subfamily)